MWDIYRSPNSTGAGTQASKYLSKQVLKEGRKEGRKEELARRHDDDDMMM